MYSGLPSLQVECPMCRLPITYNLTQLQSFASKELKEEEVSCFLLEKCVQEFGCCLQNCARMFVFCIFACINTKGEIVIYSNPGRAINPYIITPLDVLYFILRLSPSCFKYVLFILPDCLQTKWRNKKTSKEDGVSVWEAKEERGDNWHRTRKKQIFNRHNIGMW